MAKKNRRKSSKLEFLDDEDEDEDSVGYDYSDRQRRKENRRQRREEKRSGYLEVDGDLIPIQYERDDSDK